MTIILGFCGRRGSGKSTLARHVVDNAVRLFPRLVATVDYPGGHSKTGVDVRRYAMAQALKEFCINVLGLPRDKVCGSDDDKLELTRYRWEDLPHYPYIVEEYRRKRGPGRYPWLAKRVPPPAGLMTIRQVLQEFGTGVVRRMWADAWNQACLAMIARDVPAVATIEDVRFPDEVAAVTRAGGLVFYLPRSPHADAHSSELSVEKCRELCTHNLYNDVLSQERSLKMFESALARHTAGVDARERGFA